MLQQFQKNKERCQKYFGYFFVGIGIVVVYFMFKNMNIIMVGIKNFILIIRPIN